MAFETSARPQVVAGPVICHPGSLRALGGYWFTWLAGIFPGIPVETVGRRRHGPIRSPTGARRDRGEVLRRAPRLQPAHRVIAAGQGWSRQRSSTPGAAADVR